MGSKYELLVVKFFIEKREAKLEKTLSEVKSEVLCVEGFKLNHLLVPGLLFFLGEAAILGGSSFQGLVIIVEFGGVCLNKGIFLTKHHYFEVI